MPSYQLKQLSSEKFNDMEKEWQSCLKNSLASPLFSSWIWQKTWWEIWQPRLNLDLLLLGVYQHQSLIGIAPCYTYIHKYPFGLKVKRCEWIGNYSPNDDSIRSEYLNFILPASLYEQILPNVFDYLKQQQIDEVILRDLNAEGPPADWIGEKFPAATINFDKGIKVNTEQPFTSYLATLGKNTRLKLYNRRNKLDSPNIDTVQTTAEIQQFFNHLNNMHLQRWSKPCFSRHSLSFHYQIAEYYMSRNQLHAISLRENEKTIATCYDITINNTRFNLQLGFHPHPNHKISVGTLMLGYAIEQAHEQSTIKEYDLLAGSGKNSFYKKQFKGYMQPFITFMIPLGHRATATYSIKKQLQRIKHIFFK